ncbi:MAG: TfuA-related McrA-glycine thioamidation protein, partial [Methanoregula sp.]|nr:TfuA-related McrA-glycine thioamidation protein [Methanoregula sp.]
NIRFTLRDAERQGVISARDHAALLAAAQSVFYPKRTYAKVVAVAGEDVPVPVRERFLSWVTLHATDQKRNDAVAALEYIRELANIP